MAVKRAIFSFPLTHTFSTILSQSCHRLERPVSLLYACITRLHHYLFRFSTEDGGSMFLKSVGTDWWDSWCCNQDVYLKKLFLFYHFQYSKCFDTQSDFNLFATLQHEVQEKKQCAMTEILSQHVQISFLLVWPVQFQCLHFLDFMCMQAGTVVENSVHSCLQSSVVAWWISMCQGRSPHNLFQLSPPSV